MEATCPQGRSIWLWSEDLLKSTSDLEVVMTNQWMSYSRNWPRKARKSRFWMSPLVARTLMGT